MKVFVTGGAGFIGSNFCDYVLQQSEVKSLIILDKFTYAGLEANLEVACKDSRTKLLKGDICEAEKYKSEIQSADVIFNFAAESHVDNSISSPEEFINTNVIGTFRLLEVLRQSKGQNKFIQVSTDEVYGSLNMDSPSSTENSPLDPSSPYSASKAGADHLVLSYEKTYGLNALITRSSNNYGPRQLPEKLIPKSISHILEDKKIPLYGTGTNIRDWIYVEDNCRGIWQAGLRGEKGQVYHFASSTELDNLSLLKSLLKNMSKPESLIEFVSDRLGHDLRYSLNTEKTKKKLNWTAKTDFETGLLKTIDWYKNNRTWIQLALANLKNR